MKTSELEKKSFQDLTLLYEEKLREHKQKLSDQKTNLRLVTQQKPDKQKEENFKEVQKELTSQQEELRIILIQMATRAEMDQSWSILETLGLAYGPKKLFKDRQAQLEKYSGEFEKLDKQLKSHEHKLDLLEKNKQFLAKVNKQLMSKDINFTEIENLLKDGEININFCDDDGKTAIHCAVEAQNIEMIKFLLKQKGISVNYVSINDEDPDLKEKIEMKMASNDGYDAENRGKFQLEYDTLKHKMMGRKPLNSAFEKYNSEIVLLLIIKGADVNNMRADEEDNSGWKDGVDPRISPLLSIAMLDDGILYTEEQILAIYELFKMKPPEFEIGGTKSARMWATELILQHTTPQDLQEDFKDLLKEDKRARAEFLLPLARKYFGCLQSIENQFLEKGWDIHQEKEAIHPSSRKSSYNSIFSRSPFGHSPNASSISADTTPKGSGIFRFFSPKRLSGFSQEVEIISPDLTGMGELGLGDSHTQPSHSPKSLRGFFSFSMSAKPLKSNVQDDVIGPN